MILLDAERLRKTSSLALAIATIILFLLLKNESDKLEEVNTLNEQLGAELKQTVTKYGEQVSQIQTLQGMSENAFLQLNSKDSTIISLQNMVENYKGKLRSATLILNTTSSIGNIATDAITYHDTIIKDSIIYIYPTYTSNWSNKWETGLISATRDSIMRDIKITNEYEITLGDVKNGFLKKKTNEVIVKNLNPNTLTDEIKTFEVIQKDKRVNLSAQAGYGIGLNNMRPTPYVGFGISFSLIGIK